MGKALYRKYRSRSLDEIVGQPHITTTLANAIKSGQISHAYLFTGPRGVGKTSIARILAHQINDLPYSEDSTHLDIIEIDAASNRRIDEIREIRDRVHIAPTSAKYKVYIIDEVHMLTKEAFNALLKTLEEPPAHVVFILATTEAHKLPETIVSRTQRHNFKPVEKTEVISHLQQIADKEQITIDEPALALVAAHGGGSFRDSISLLDQLGSSGEPIDLTKVQNVLGIAPERLVAELIRNMQENDSAAVVKLLTNAQINGYNSSILAKQIASEIRNLLLATDPWPGPKQATTLLQRLLGVPTTHDPTAALEIALLELTLHSTTSTTTLNKLATPKADVPKSIEKPEVQNQLKAEKPVKPAKKPAEITQVTAKSTASGDLWPEALKTIKSTYSTLYSVARMAQPTELGDTLKLEFEFAFHQNRLNEAKNKQILTEVVSKLAGRPITIECMQTTNKSAKATAVEPPAATSTKNAHTISTISNIFGGAEVLES